MHHIVIVIPTFNRREYIQKLLSQIAAQEIENVDVRTVVVVDGSTDGTSEMIRSEFPAVHVVE